LLKIFQFKTLGQGGENRPSKLLLIVNFFHDQNYKGLLSFENYRTQPTSHLPSSEINIENSLNSDDAFEKYRFPVPLITKKRSFQNGELKSWKFIKKKFLDFRNEQIN